MRKPEFTAEEIALLAQAEREMDSGVTPFVHIEGADVRLPLDPEDMTRFGLASGQRITWVMFGAIAAHKLADCEAALAFERRKKLEEEVLGE